MIGGVYRGQVTGSEVGSPVEVHVHRESEPIRPVGHQDWDRACRILSNAVRKDFARQVAPRCTLERDQESVIASSSRRNQGSGFHFFGFRTYQG